LKKLQSKKQHLQYLQKKVESNIEKGEQAAGGNFKQCIEFFTERVNLESDDLLSDQQGLEIERFIKKYDNSAQITQILWQIFYLQLEQESESKSI
jgi:hypothetical protein